MITRVIFDLGLWVLEAILTGLAYVIPQTVLDIATGLPGALEPWLQFTPVTTVFAVLLAYWAFDLLANGINFALEAYKLIPAKAT